MKAVIIIFLVIFIANVIAIVYHIKNEQKIRAYNTNKYRRALNPTSNDDEILREIESDIKERESKLLDVSARLDKLKNQETRTKKDILSLTDDMMSIGLTKHNRTRFILSFLLGIVTSILSAAIYEVMSN